MNKIYNMRSQIPSIVFMILILLSVFLGLITTNVITGVGAFFSNLGSTWVNIVILDIIFTAYLICLLLIVKKTSAAPLFIYRPITLIFIFFIVIVILGSLNYYFVTMFFPQTRVANIPKGLFYLCVISLSIMAGYHIRLLPYKLFESRNTYEQQTKEWDLSKLKVLIIVLFIIMIIGNIIAYRKIGAVAFLHKAVGNVRFYFSEEMGIWEKFIKITPTVIMLSGTYFFLKKNELSMLAILVVSSILAFISTVRFYFVMPLMVLVLVYFKMAKKVNVRNIIILLVALSVIIYGFGLVLSVRVPITAGTRLPGMLFYLQSSPNVEFIDFCRIIQRIEESGPEKAVTIFHSLIAPVLPKQFWSILDIDKKMLLSEHAYLMWDLISGWACRLRVGSFGELYLFGGWLALITGSFILGLIISWIDLKLINLNRKDSRIVIFCFLCIIFVLTPILQLYAVSDMVVFNGVVMMVAHFLCRKRVKNSL